MFFVKTVRLPNYSKNRSLIFVDRQFHATNTGPSAIIITITIHGTEESAKATTRSRCLRRVTDVDARGACGGCRKGERERESSRTTPFTSALSTSAFWGSRTATYSSSPAVHHATLSSPSLTQDADGFARSVSRWSKQKWIAEGVVEEGWI